MNDDGRRDPGNGRVKKGDVSSLLLGAGTAIYLASRASAYTCGQVIAVDGGTVAVS